MNTPETVPDKAGYWDRRAGMLYYQCVADFVAGFAPRGGSVIDVGSKDSAVLEHLYWFKRRHALDLRRPYRSETVKGIKRDFFKFEPRRRYRLALCLQVLEHVPDAATFARKLFDVANNVIISVPYMWPDKSSRHHVHDMIDEGRLAEWTGRQPDHSVIIQEPLTAHPKSRRIVAYYQHPSKPFSLNAARKAVAARQQAVPPAPAPTHLPADAPAISLLTAGAVDDNQDRVSVPIALQLARVAREDQTQMALDELTKYVQELDLLCQGVLDDPASLARRRRLLDHLGDDVLFTMAQTPSRISSYVTEANARAELVRRVLGSLGEGELNSAATPSIKRSIHALRHTLFALGTAIAET